METVEIKLPDGRKSKILIGEKYTNVSAYLPKGNVIFIVDENVYKYYSFFDKHSCIKITTGESFKTLETVETIVSKLIEMNADRNTFLVGVGGGITCDVTGFVASIFMRGVHFGFISTSLLSQVDASVGGKNGVNFHKYKNMIGVFNQPDFVICDIQMLKTLPKTEFIAGLSEIVKMAIIADADLFGYLEHNISSIFYLTTEAISQIVTRSVQIKADIVNRDEHEAGERRKLNLGHTLAHAIEKNSQTIHGFAVSIGIVFSAKVSQRYGLIQQADVNRILRLLQSFSLPVKTEIPKANLLEAIKKDKKKDGDEIKFILINKIGEVAEKSIKISEFDTLLDILYETPKPEIYF